MDTMDINEIYKKLQTDWAAWTDEDEHQCLSICKKELIAANQAINSYLVNFYLKTRIEKDPTPKVCQFCEKTYKGAEPVCDKCLLDIKLRLRKLSCLLGEEDASKVYDELLHR